MAKGQLSETDFVRMLQEMGPAELAKHLGCSVRSVNGRRKRLEDKLGKPIFHATTRMSQREQSYSVRQEFKIKDGVVIVFSDAHYWPNDITTAHVALLHFIRKLKPACVVANGDVMDGAEVSRHPPGSWEIMPSLSEEIETCKLRLAEIKKAMPKDAKRFWTLGNHDARFESRLAKVAPEYAEIHGVHLKDHFPDWTPCMALSINERSERGKRIPHVAVKHNFKGGIHATHNNPIWAGTHMVTGHLHQLKTTPVTTYNNTVWGVDTGTLAEPFSPQFDYAMDNPSNHRSGFAVLTFKDGLMLDPELVSVWDNGVVNFRGELHEVKI